MSKSIDPVNDNLARELERAKFFPPMPELRDSFNYQNRLSESDKMERKIRTYSEPDECHSPDAYLDELDAYDNYEDEYDILDDCDDAHILYRGPGN